MRKRQREPIARIEGEVRRLLDCGGFRIAYPDAYRLWAEAEALLWDDASEQNLSTMQHIAGYRAQDGCWLASQWRTRWVADRP